LHELSQISQGFSRLLEVNWCEFVSGADGIGDTEGKAATGSGERAGRQASFKFVSGSLALFGVFGGQIFGCGGEPRRDK